ncbi:peptidoglycan-associated lipoprotein Pal [Marinagarivorans cellulosilyticus]|uniref:Peptidoglycan-associated lipoprotein n=1 Tax=Marinagarivorans cellulosilyticus TaxID=2721545 RepID=A0AAN1WK75_9GAMM|nr:peptidoglycan-associated lipoprotein Pal [Marinagarivorans cellulosilyticus]BCD99080.1 peptidoglycan-associated lipoprotein [Marinagarivorans cellulosilyticus]
MKKMYSAIAFAAAFGLMTGCSSNKPTETVAPEVVEPVETETVEQVIEEPVVIDTTFYFEFDSSDLTTAARAALMLHAEQLSASPRSVRLEGHADERGSREYNMALGERRANAVRDYLVLQGVDAASIETVSYGEESPAEMGSGEMSWSKNRRVELK